MYKIVILVITVFAILSCKKYSIEKEIKDWIPYSKGQIILFESNKGTIDTLRVIGTMSLYNPKDNWSLTSSQHEKMIIYADVPTDVDAHNGSRRKTIPRPFIVIDANSESTTIKLTFGQYRSHFQSIGNEILKMERNRIKIGSRSYNDVIIFHCNQEYWCQRSNNKSTILWSDQYGIIRYNIGIEEFTIVL